jgi:hypothetical protein
MTSAEVPPYGSRPGESTSVMRYWLEQAEADQDT